MYVRVSLCILAYMCMYTYVSIYVNIVHVWGMHVWCRSFDNLQLVKFLFNAQHDALSYGAHSQYGMHRQTYLYSNTHYHVYALVHAHLHVRTENWSWLCLSAERSACSRCFQECHPQCSFEGLSFLSAGEKRSYMHCRKPESLQGTLHLYGREWVASCWLSLRVE